MAYIDENLALCDKCCESCKISAIGATSQTSGVTQNDFTSPVVYAVKSQDTLTTVNYTVTVTILPA